MNTNIVFLLMLPKFSLAIIPECKSVEENVVCTLVTHYDKDVPPPTIGNQPVPIDVLVELRHISDIDEEKHTISFVAYIFLSWVDPRLKIPANPKKMNQLLDEVWIPDTYFQNAVQVKSIPNMKANSGKRFYVYDSYVGLVDEVAITFECKMNFDQFPFDHQNCAFEILGTPLVILNQISLQTRHGKTINTSPPNGVTTFNSSGLSFDVQLRTPETFLLDGYDSEMPVVAINFYLLRKSEKGQCPTIKAIGYWRTVYPSLLSMALIFGM